MPVYHCHKPVLWSKWPLASSLLQAIKICRQACPSGYLMHFSQGWIPESLVSNNSKLTKLLKVCWNVYFLYSLGGVTFNKCWITLTILYRYSPNFQGFSLMKNAINNQVGMLGDMFLWLVANLKQGGIYFIKQALPPNISAGSVQKPILTDLYIHMITGQKPPKPAMVLR